MATPQDFGFETEAQMRAALGMGPDEFAREEARFGDPDRRDPDRGPSPPTQDTPPAADPNPPGARAAQEDALFIRDNRDAYWLLETTTGTRHRVGNPGTGSHQAARSIYGAPLTRSSQLPSHLLQRQEEEFGSRDEILLDISLGFSEGPSAVEVFGGPNEMERVAAGHIPDPLTGRLDPTPSAITTGSGDRIPNVSDLSTSELTDLLGDDRTRDAFGTLRLVLERAGIGELVPWVWEMIQDGRSASWVEAELPQQPAFRERFPAIEEMQSRGMRPPSVEEYLSYERNIGQVVSQFNLPGEFADREHVTNMLINQKSANELQSELSDLSSQILTQSDGIREFYRTNFGVDGLSDGAILASAFTPGVPPDVFERRIRTAQVGGTAAEFGFDRSPSRAGRLAESGLDLAGARDLFSQAQDVVPTVQGLLDRHFDPGSDFDIADFEDAAVFGDPEANRRIQRIFQRERAMFTPDAGFETTQEGEMVGLRQR